MQQKQSIFLLLVLFFIACQSDSNKEQTIAKRESILPEIQGIWIHTSHYTNFLYQSCFPQTVLAVKGSKASILGKQLEFSYRLSADCTFYTISEDTVKPFSEIIPIVNFQLLPSQDSLILEDDFYKKRDTFIKHPINTAQLAFIENTDALLGEWGVDSFSCAGGICIKKFNITKIEKNVWDFVKLRGGEVLNDIQITITKTKEDCQEPQKNVFFSQKGVRDSITIKGIPSFEIGESCDYWGTKSSFERFSDGGLFLELSLNPTPKNDPKVSRERCLFIVQLVDENTLNLIPLFKKNLYSLQLTRLYQPTK